MKATLEFNLPDEADEYTSHIEGDKYRGAIYDLSKELRARDKYTEDPLRAEIWEEFRILFYTILTDNDVSDF